MCGFAPFAIFRLLRLISHFIPIFCILSASIAENLTIQLVRAEEQNKPVETAQVGKIAPYSRYRGPLTTWAFGINVDGKSYFDVNGKRYTILNLDLPEGEHIIQPGCHRFRIVQGKVESLSPDLIVRGNHLLFRLYPVTFVSFNDGGQSIPVWLTVKYRGKEVWRSPPALFASPLTLYLPATMEGGYETNISNSLLHVDGKGAKFLPNFRDDFPSQAVQTDGFKVRIPSFNITTVILIDKPLPGAYGIGISGREEATQAFEAYGAALGNWDPRPKGTFHSSLQFSLFGWRFRTLRFGADGQNEWLLRGEEIQSFKHHIFIIDRPFFSTPDGMEKEQVLHIALSSDIVQPNGRIKVLWRWVNVKGLEVMKEPKLVAFVQQAPSFADDEEGWEKLRVVFDGRGEAILHLPASLKEGIAWLRIGITESEQPKPTERLMCEIKLVVEGGKKVKTSPKQYPKLKTVQIGKPLKRSNVPQFLRQGTFLHPQSVSALDISDDGEFIAIATMAFRNDKNFWLISQNGELLWGRYAFPWAPHQVAVLPFAKVFGVGLAYSRFTEPTPTIVLFGDEKGEEKVFVDSIWDLGFVRYGSGDWKNGWIVSFLGDLFVRAHNFLFTVMSDDGAWRIDKDCGRQHHPFNYQRPFRMAASADGHVVAYGYLVPNVSEVDAKLVEEMRLPPAGLVVWNSLTAGTLWSAMPISEAIEVKKPPEPSDEFPEISGEFGMKPRALVPFRVIMSVALSGDGSKVAVTEYGGWIRIKQRNLIGSWSGHGHVSFVTRQSGWLRVFDAFGKELVRTKLPKDGLFEAHIDEKGEKVWCVPMSWFSRGLAGYAWLPTDPNGETIFIYDIGKKAWINELRFPDAVSDFAMHSGMILVSCWDGKVYLLRGDSDDNKLLANIEVSFPSILRWSANGSFAIAGTHNGEVWRIERDGKVSWRVKLPVSKLLAQSEPLKPEFDGVPVYRVGRTGPEHAYIGDMWLIKVKDGAIMVDCGGTSSIPYTWQRMRAIGVEPKDVRYVLLSHSHGDHLGAMYLWRTLGAKTIAPATAAFATVWMVPTWNGYGIWVPCPIDIPLPLKRPGDETEITILGVKVRAIFVPGHSIDSVVYAMELNGKRVIFTGDSFLENTLYHCWGDVEKAKILTELLRSRVLPIKPEFAFMGHISEKNAEEFLLKVLKASEEKINAALRKGDEQK